MITLYYFINDLLKHLLNYFIKYLLNYFIKYLLNYFIKYLLNYFINYFLNNLHALKLAFINNIRIIKNIYRIKRIIIHK